MRLLLDTHAVLWWMDDNSKLSAAARQAISDPGNTIWVSAATSWEISIKMALGKLEAPADLEGAIRQCGFQPLPIQFGHGIAVGHFPPLHHDPFDRMLIAQALTEDLTLVSHDARFRAYGVRLLET
jgi:PIN domain nuclease of toxin-antitoxin system